ncbi:hypothetical protein CR513_55330, partial [Mucuna pruriens]
MPLTKRCDLAHSKRETWFSRRIRSSNTRLIQMRSNCSTLKSSTREGSKGSAPEFPGWRSQPRSIQKETLSISN